MNYYNEWEPYRAEWLRNLIRDGLIPDGKVDERDIEEVKPEDLEGFSQCHWFAGVAGWPQALSLANWLPDVPAWTGSCPCQPLSCAGKREGEKDVRHLWPVFYRLICKRRPPVVFGEQTASGDGPEWVAGVRLDLEAAGYRVGIANLPAASVGAPHPRSRLWWVANSTGARRGQPRGTGETLHARTVQSRRCGGVSGRMADAGGERTDEPRQAESCSDRQDDGISRANSVAACGLGNANGQQRAGEPIHVFGREPRPSDSDADRAGRLSRRLADANGIGTGIKPEELQAGQSESGGEGFWSDYQVLYRNEPKRGLVPCRAEPGVFPLAAGFPTRVEQVSAYGDSIVPQAAAEFVKAFMESLG